MLIEGEMDVNMEMLERVEYNTTKNINIFVQMECQQDV
jgi:hypothetical protein